MKKDNFREKSIRGLSPKASPTTINERLEWLRCVLGYPVGAFANKIGSSKFAVINVLGEKSDDPSVRMVKNICHVFPVNEMWIWGGIGEPFTSDYTNFIYSNEITIPEIDLEVNKRLKEVREDTGFTQALFASEIGSTRDSLAFVEIGKTNLSLINAKQAIKKFNVNCEWLLFGVGPKYKKPKH